MPSGLLSSLTQTFPDLLRAFVLPHLSLDQLVTLRTTCRSGGPARSSHSSSEAKPTRLALGAQECCIRVCPLSALGDKHDIALHGFFAFRKHCKNMTFVFLRHSSAARSALVALARGLITESTCLQSDENALSYRCWKDLLDNGESTIWQDAAPKWMHPNARPPSGVDAVAAQAGFRYALKTTSGIHHTQATHNFLQTC